MAELERLLQPFPWAYSAIALLGLLLAAWAVNWITRRVLLRGARALMGATPLEDAFERRGVVDRLSYVVPVLVISTGIDLVPAMPEVVVAVVRNVCAALVVLAVAMAIGAFLDLLHEIYERRPEARHRPIKGFLQIVTIVVYGIAALLMIASIIDRSPVILLSGVGAMAAVLMLIFQDTLLSLAASVQISTNDMIRIGDWIEMPQLNADGDVIDIALHTVKVQNWDKTITTIPTKRLISESFRNWRGMRESGGRRIKRALYLDQRSVRFMNADELRALRRFALLDGYLEQKRVELEEWNTKLSDHGRELVNTRRITNIGCFRAYVERYLRAHPRVKQDMSLMVRQLAPGPTGLPLEIYCFTATIVWTEYEGIQADIFDHLFAIVSEFDLELFQQPSGVDLRNVAATLSARSAAALSQPELTAVQ